jgi:hypothetical protein
MILLKRWSNLTVLRSSCVNNTEFKNSKTTFMAKFRVFSSQKYLLKMSTAVAIRAPPQNNFYGEISRIFCPKTKIKNACLRRGEEVVFAPCLSCLVPAQLEQRHSAHLYLRSCTIYQDSLKYEYILNYCLN